MGLIKVARSAEDLNNVPYIKKEISGRWIVLLKQNSVPVCYVLTGEPAISADGSPVIPSHAQSIEIYNDGALWINMPEENKVAMGVVGSGYGLGNLLSQRGLQNMAPPPPPLVPFAGCDRKAMPPSPLQFKQTKGADSGKQSMAASRKISFNDNRQSQIMDFFGPKAMEF